MTTGIPYEFGVDYAFEDIFPDASAIAGVKAVFSPPASQISLLRQERGVTRRRSRIENSLGDLHRDRRRVEGD